MIMAETKDPSPLPLSRKPDEGCHATKEELIQFEGKKPSEDCPGCAAFNVRCMVLSHPSSAIAGNGPFFLICSAHIQLN